MFRAIHDYLRLNYHQKKASSKKIKAYQERALKRIYKHAITHSPFYQTLYQGYSCETLDDVQALPIIDKSIMMEHFTDINTVGIKKEDVMTYAVEKEKNQDYLGYYQNQFVVGLSSGTSGNKGIFITPKKLTKRLPAVFLARSGLSLKTLPYRILFMLRVFSQGFNDINAPFIKLKYLSTMTKPETIVDTMIQERTNILMTPPSLLRHLLPLQDTMPKLKKIITYAEVLSPIDKAQFEAAFKTQVIEIYQASEGQIASACKYGKLHINEDLVYVELLDDEDKTITKPHIIGKSMLITNLVNDAQPLIRYRMNDMIVLDDPCPCGSSFRTIKQVIGRDDEVMYFINEKNQTIPVYPDLIARWIITESDSIREFQVVQASINTLDVRVDASATFSSMELKNRLTKELLVYGINAKIDVRTERLTLPNNLNKFKRFKRLY